ncbi:UNVERIFIED_CONTAM: hypothetical protein GTU68_022520, partial [Idotea baltica]|nr:hypothetical protein [Idotea baltica]
MPNAGKSTLFNRLCGGSAKVANWPGVTVDLLSSKLLLASDMVELVDLPGIYDLHGFSDDEQVVRHFLTHNEVDLVLVVANAPQLDRQLSLTLQLKSLNMPAVVMLNMADEAKKMGIGINVDALSQALGYPTVLLSAKYGQGYAEAYHVIEQAMQNAQPCSVQALEDGFTIDQAIEKDLDVLVKQCIDFPAQAGDSLTSKIDTVLLHPLLGLPLFFTFMFLLFQAVYTIGGPLQEAMAWLFENFRDLVLMPLLSFLPPALNGFLIDGVYDGIATVASFVPIIIVFFWFMAIIEDSGYLSRAAFLMDALM